MSEVKTYMVRGTALFNESEFPVRQNFVKYVRALNENQAKERVYADFGSKNKIKRKSIQILEVKEVDPSTVKEKRIKELSKLDKIVL
ncbi:50S ribosomal protein L18Ae [Metallosphaera hakonensis]|uniref:Large ribosomal subunit protein eL20 n=1 Tax=Metallosphaera hakonensis JCM 8857 = DSM 7519 TaxID=1293036 RepID=A0A2U9IVE4_9CREN|nr:50S ribosomal protein L18Ae [Metallosphaera hakonensis]AWS00051.1 50S ribosomal protein L18a [Metallosphaera hakonensis JCM 8857 = DSM 7519]